MEGSVSLTVLAVLVGWPIAALALGLVLGRAMAACASHDTTAGDAGLDVGLGVGPATHERIPARVHAVSRDAV